MRRTGAVLIGLTAILALFAPWLSPNPPDRRFTELLYAPPTTVHVFDGHGGGPHVHALRVVMAVVPPECQADGRIVSSQHPIAAADADIARVIAAVGFFGHEVHAGGRCREKTEKSRDRLA